MSADKGTLLPTATMSAYIALPTIATYTDALWTGDHVLVEVSKATVGEDARFEIYVPDMRGPRGQPVSLGMRAPGHAEMFFRADKSVTDDGKDLPLAEAVDLSGRVLLAGKPVSGFRVGATRNRPGVGSAGAFIDGKPSFYEYGCGTFANTDSDGGFRLSGVPLEGDAWPEIWLTGAKGDLRLTVSKCTPSSNPWLQLEVATPQPPTGQWVIGRVMDRAGNGVVGASVRVEVGLLASATSAVDDEGWFRLPPPPPDADAPVVRVVAPEYGTMLVRIQDAAEIVLQTARPRVFVARGIGGRLLPNVRIDVLGPPGTRSVVRNGTTDSAGRWQCDWLPERGTLQVTVFEAWRRAPLLGKRWADEVELGPGDEIVLRTRIQHQPLYTVRLALSGPTLRGLSARARAASGVPMADPVVLFSRALSLGPVPAGTYVVTLLSWNRAPSVHEVQVRPGGETISLEIPRGVTLSGTVTGVAKGEQLTVRIARVGKADARMQRPLVGGRFEIPGLTPGLWKIRVCGPSGELRKVEVIEIGTKDVTMHLDLR